jgi:hypothetical protein
MMEANANATVHRIHYYHADVNALGGHLKTPIAQPIPVQAPLSLPPVGGYASTRVGAYQLEGILSFASAYSQVAGSISEKDGGWTTLATVAVEGLNVHDILTADRVVSQIATEHPREGYEPKVTFIGTRFDNLRIGGYPLEVDLDLGLCSPGGSDRYPAKSCFDDERFLAAVAEQYRRMADEKSLAPWVKDRQIPNWVRARYTWDNSQAKRQEKGFVLCSLVKEIRGEFPGRAYGHVLEVPEFGKAFLGELIVDHNSFRVIGIRLELGCASHGSGSVGTASIEGRTYP